MEQVNHEMLSLPSYIKNISTLNSV